MNEKTGALLKRIFTENQDEIFLRASELIDNEEKYNLMANAINPYGDGRASEYIVDAVLDFLKEKDLV